MSNGAAAGGAAAAAAAAAMAIKASGAIVRVEPDMFLSLVNRTDNPLVIVSQSKFFTTSYKYLTKYKGFFFFTKTSAQLNLPGKAERIAAKSIMVPQ